MNENDIEMKWNYDPTDTLKLQYMTDITYKQIFLEVTQFINDNNKKNNKRYMEYPKLHLNSNKPKCSNKMKCDQCGNNNSTGSDVCFSLCSIKRREIANELFGNAQRLQCRTESLSTTGKQLFVSDKILTQDSNEYKLNKNWFVNVYSFLKWQQEVVNVLL